jgi:hypothetical protein
MAVFSIRPDQMEDKNMTKNVWFLGLLACVLALGTLLAGCETPTNADKWSPVTSLSQMDGTWKFSYSETQTLPEWAAGAEFIINRFADKLPPEALTYLPMISMMSNVKVTAEVEGTLTINAAAQTVKSSGTATMTFSGEGAGGAYFMLKLMSGRLGEYGITDVQFNDSKNSITMPSYDFGPVPINDDDMAALLANTDMQINQNGKKIKISRPDSKDIILTKQ